MSFLNSAENINGILPITPVIPSYQQALPYLFQPPTADLTDSAYFQSYIGTPVYSNLVIDSVPAVPATATSPGSPAIDGLRLDTVLFSIENSKNIVLTDIPGRKDQKGNEIPGTIKEYIGLGDWQINIQGMIVSPYPNVFPKADLLQFVKLFKVSNQLRVSSDFLNQFSVSAIVIMSMRWSEVMGSRNMINFGIQAVSDADASVNDQGYYQV